MGVKRVIKNGSQKDAITLSQAFEGFVIEKEARNRSEATIRNYRQSYEYFVQFTELTYAKEVTEGHFFDWITTMKKEGVKPASINHYLRDCRAFFYWCMKKGYIKTAFTINMIGGQEEQPKTFNDTELASLLEKPRKKDSFVDWRAWAIVNWILATGNRESTVCYIKLGDIDYMAKEITLRHTKNKKAQIIPLSPSLEVAIKEYVRLWRSDADEEAWLFPSVADEQLTTNALRHSFSRYCREKEVTKTSLHGLRHSFAKGWVKNNGNTFALQKILGHSTLDMTKRYVKLFSDDIKEDYGKFSPLDTITQTNKRTHTVKRRG